MDNKFFHAEELKGESHYLYPSVANNSLRLKKRSDFKELSIGGKAIYGSNWIILKVKKNQHTSHQVGWTIPKYVGNAVLRNKFKRWLRDILERKGNLNNSALKDNYDLNFIFRKKPPEFFKDINYKIFEKVVLDAIHRIEKNKYRTIK